MRRYGRLAALVAVLALVLAGCSSKAKTTAGPSTTPSGKFKLLIPGIFTIGTDMPYAPFESLNAKGVPVGFDIELFEEIAIFCLFDRAERGAEQAYVVAVEHAGVGQLHRQVEASLPAERW